MTKAIARGAAVSRRGVLAGFGGMTFCLALGANGARLISAAEAATSAKVFNSWVRIAPDGMVTILSAGAEMGQGSMTSLPLIVAEEMDAAGLPGREPQLWERVRSMGQELLPGHALFGMPERSATAPSGVEGKGIGQEPLSDMDELANLDLDLSSDLSQMASELHDGSVLDLSPRPKTAAPPPGRPTAPPPGAPDQESEFTLNLDDLSSLEDIDLGDLRLDSEVSLKTKSTHKKDVLSLPDKESTAPFFALSEEDEIPAISLDEVDLDMGGFEPTGVGGGTSSSEPLKTTDLGEEVETKLDLARAYLEMGDGEGAREILQEVLAEGNPTQQATARELLTQVR